MKGNYVLNVHRFIKQPRNCYLLQLIDCAVSGISKTVTKKQHDSTKYRTERQQKIVFGGHIYFVKSKREMRQYPRENDAWKYRFQSSSDRHGHLLASLKHHSTDLGRRVVICLGLSAVTKHCRALHWLKPSGARGV